MFRKGRALRVRHLDMGLRERLDHGRARDLHGESRRRDCDRDGGKDHALEISDEARADRDVLRLVERAEIVRRDEQEENAGQEDRDREDAEEEHADRRVPDPIRMDGGDDTERHAQKRRQHDGEKGELERDGELLRQLRPDAEPADRRGAEAQADGVPQPLEVGDVQGAVEAQVVPDLLDLLGCGAVGADDHGSDVAGRDSSSEEEDDDRDGEEHGNEPGGLRRGRSRPCQDRPARASAGALSAGGGRRPAK